MRSQALIQTKDNFLTICRKRHGNGFQYLSIDNDLIRDKKVIKRIKGLVIPPMWENVKISRNEQTHIQAIGRDLKGRKQYIYHPLFMEQRQQEKFDKMQGFARKLPQMRKKAYEFLSRRGWRKNKVLSLIILLLDEYGIRIGNKQYLNRNNTYGLTNLRRKHLDIQDDELILHFKGKKSIEREVTIDNEELVEYVKKSAEQPGYELFRYTDKKRKKHTIDSEDVNEFIHKYMGEDYSSKDFRTWTACKLAIEYYPEAIEEKKHAPRKKLQNIVLDKVSQDLGNTRSVCKTYYVHPNIARAIESKGVESYFPIKEKELKYALSAHEKVALQIIE